MGLRSVITGSGCYVPTEVKTNRDFTVHDFYADDHKRIETPSTEIVEKFRQITGIEERLYASIELNSAEIGAYAAKEAVVNSGIDPETLDHIIVAQNFGNVIKHTIQTDNVPSIASRIKNSLGIKNPNCIAYDVLFGCPGWVQGMIQAHAFFKAGIAKKCLVVGTETLSRVIDVYDRDSMIFSDGAGAVVLEAKEAGESSSGILGFSMQSHCNEEAYYIYMGKSNFPASDPRVRYIKMKGRKVYEYAMKHVPLAMKDCLDKSGVDIRELKKIFLHQANEKMDEGIIKSMYKLYGISEMPEHIMPMNIHTFGNSSVATVPTLYDLVKKGKMDNHQLESGDVVLFASVGAGMNINAFSYRI